MNHLTQRGAFPTPESLQALSQAIQRLLVDAQFEQVQTHDGGGNLVITAQRSPYSVLAVIGVMPLRKRVSTSAGGPVAPLSP